MGNFHKIVFAHTKFGLVRIKGSGVKRERGSAAPRVLKTPVQMVLIEVMGGLAVRLLPKAVQQLKMLPRADTKLHSLAPQSRHDTLF